MIGTLIIIAVVGFFALAIYAASQDKSQDSFGFRDEDGDAEESGFDPDAW